MKKSLIGLIVCSFLVLPAVCFGATGWYGSVNAGVALASDSDITYNDGSPDERLEFDSGYTVGGAIGHMVEGWRLEGEVSYQENDVDKVDGLPAASGQDVSLMTFLVNGYMDLTTGKTLTPYLTAGIGASKVEINGSGASLDDTVFAYQLGVGVGFSMSETVILDGRYRFLGTTKPEFTYSGVTGEGEVANHNFTLGLRMAF